MGVLKKIFTNTRVVILLAALLLSLVAIWPNPDARGVAIRSVTPDSAATQGGFENPESSTPMSWEVLTSINNRIIEDEIDYFEALETLEAGTPAIFITDKKSYTVVPRNKTEEIQLDELEPVISKADYEPGSENYTNAYFEIEEIQNFSASDLEIVSEYSKRFIKSDYAGVVFGSLRNTNNDTFLFAAIPEGLNEPEEFLDLAEENINVNGAELQLSLTDFSDEDTLNVTAANAVIMANKTKLLQLDMEPVGLRVTKAPTSNIRKGLDLQGGTRVLLKPEDEISDSQLQTIISVLKERLNVYGLSDVPVRAVSDLSLSDNQFILVEVAGANEEEVRDLISRQGKFEAKIGNETVFRGGDKDIVNVDRTAQSGINPENPCRPVGPSYWTCGFRFGITLSLDAARKHAEITNKLDVLTDENGNRYLSEPLVLYLDDKEVDSLQISADLKGSETTHIAISGPGNGTSEANAVENTLENMKTLQTVLSTGSLPTKLEVVKADNISPLLGDEFVHNAMRIGAIAIFFVSLLVFIRYRKLSIAVPLVLTSLSEIVLIMGFASFVGWNIDLAAVAGIIIAIGTGVDHQIVISDETLRSKGSSYQTTWKDKLKRAFYIIMGAYFTTVAAMFPLWFAGAGLLRGFAITTIFGITAGVFIARPAFANTIEILINKE